jgi:hypothetical protein
MVSLILLFEAKLKRESAKMALGALSTLKLQIAKIKRTGFCSAPSWPVGLNKNILLTVNPLLLELPIHGLPLFFQS